MIKSRSLSTYGRKLERKQKLINNPEVHLKLTERAQKNPLKVTKRVPKQILGFDKVGSREKLNSFQMCYTTKFNGNNIYEIRDQLTRTRSCLLPFTKQKSQRLKNIATQSYQLGLNICKKNKQNKRNEEILTTRDLQKSRKSFHSLDFNKQNSINHSYAKNSSLNEFSPATSLEILKQTIKQSKINSIINVKLSKIHAFSSYTNRDYLNEKKLLKGAPSHSGYECFKIPLQKYKGGWKTIQPINYDKTTGRKNFYV